MARTGYFFVVVVVLVYVLIQDASSELPCTDQSKGYSFQVFHNDTADSEVKNFTCILFGKSSLRTEKTESACIQFPKNLPNNMSNGSSVNKPRDFAVKIFSHYNGTEVCPGLQYTWKVPIDTISREHTKGYFLQMEPVNSASVLCRTLDLQGLNMDSARMYFNFRMAPMKTPTTYLVDLYSLPPPSDDEMSEGLYQRLIITLSKCVNLGAPPNSADWTTWITVGTPKNGTVEIQFGFADDSLDYKFETYKVRLFRDGVTAAPLNETIVPHKKDGPGRVVFENVPSGNYSVQVFADDPYFQNTTACLCNRGPINGPVGGLECTSCARTETKVFWVTGKIVTTTTITTGSSVTTGSSPATEKKSTTTTGSSADTEKKSTSPEQSNTNEHESYTGAITGGVVGAVAFAALVLLLVFGFLFLQKRRNLDVCKNNNNNKPEKHPWTTDVIIFPLLTGSEQKAPPVLKRKQVFLLAAEDHPRHVAAVEKCAQFLRVHCQCDVTFAPLCRSKLRGEIIYIWMSKEIEEADYVVIVTSVAASRLYSAFQKGLSYRDADLGPEGDLFTPGIQHICGMITCHVDVKKVVMVHFEHTASDCRLPIGALPSSLYLLPKHLGEFLKHIHGLGHDNSAVSKVLPLHCDIAQLKEGSEWLAAIQEAKAYERQFPNWFEKKFGQLTEVTKRTTPILSTQESGFYSNEGGSIGSRNSAELQRKLSSVSLKADGFVSGLDNRESHVFTMDDFFEPSMVFSTYTVPPGSTFAGGSVPEEIDDRGSTTSERLRMLNQRYELYRLEESQGFKMLEPSYHEGPSVEDQMHALNARNEHAVHFAYPQVQGGVSLQHQEEDCVSITSAQSV